VKLVRERSRRRTTQASLVEVMNAGDFDNTRELAGGSSLCPGCRCSVARRDRVAALRVRRDEALGSTIGSACGGVRARILVRVSFSPDRRRRRSPIATWATSGGTAPHPHFFEGRLAQPRRTADLLLAISLVSRTRFFMPVLFVPRGGSRRASSERIANGAGCSPGRDRRRPGRWPEVRRSFGARPRVGNGDRGPLDPCAPRISSRVAPSSIFFKGCIGGGAGRGGDP
jgi:hypothetical protein